MPIPIAIPWIFGAAQAAAPYIASALGLGTTAAVYANRKEIGSSIRNLFNKDTGALPALPEGYSYEFNPVAHAQNSEFPVDALSVNTKPSGYFRLVRNNTGGLKKDSNAGQYTREELEKFKRQFQNGKLPNFNKKPDGPN